MDQLAYLDKVKTYFQKQVFSANKMAGLLTRHNFYCNFSLAGKNKLARASTNSSGTLAPILILVVSQNPTFTSILALISNNKLFKQFMKAYLNNQNHVQSSAQLSALISAAFCKQFLNNRFFDFYYENSHLDCYRFCQQYKDHFETTGANEPKRILFAILFFCSLMT